jgi:hypothetical protein
VFTALDIRPLIIDVKHPEARLPFPASGIDDSADRARYEQLMASQPKSLGALLNITTAMKQIQLPQGTAIRYLKQIKWGDSLAQDRFLACCDVKLIDQV